MIAFELEGTCSSLGEGDHDVIALESLRPDHDRTRRETGSLVVGDGLPRDNPPIPNSPPQSDLPIISIEKQNVLDRAIIPWTPRWLMPLAVMGFCNRIIPTHLIAGR